MAPPPRSNSAYIHSFITETVSPAKRRTYPLGSTAPKRTSLLARNRANNMGFFTFVG